MMDANVANVQWFTLAHNCIVVAIDRPKMRQRRRSEHKECNYEDIARYLVFAALYTKTHRYYHIEYPGKSDFTLSQNELNIFLYPIVQKHTFIGYGIQSFRLVKIQEMYDWKPLLHYPNDVAVTNQIYILDIDI
jgi:hypothetical protein